MAGLRLYDYYASCNCYKVRLLVANLGLPYEQELIRSLGADAVEEIVGANGDLRSFRTLQKQAAWRGRPREEQLRRFMGSGGRRKTRYARLLVEALDLDRVPRPLDGVLAHVRSAAAGDTPSGRAG